MDIIGNISYIMRNGRILVPLVGLPMAILDGQSLNIRISWGWSLQGHFHFFCLLVVSIDCKLLVHLLLWL